ncbi:hypothetical protein GALMADRAFT_136344 [Galerina marginata CBS 339.88]|uniref:Uncharacterized protein n=1 Tax=Galerina marginata (strain CBS 339.88) TaxID=685588 RepID=A0A067TL74_GALM3|nr:hypothetical protein GALMADRAFT_136344 [Galerina marginata CBS 339.88]
MGICKTAMTLSSPSSSLLARAAEEDSPQPDRHPLTTMAIVLALGVYILVSGFAIEWLARRNTRRAGESGPPLPTHGHVPEAGNNQSRARDTTPANIHLGTTDQQETHTPTPHVRDGAPSPPPAYNSLETLLQPGSRTAAPAPLDAAPLDLYGIPAAHLDPSNSPGELLAVHLQEGNRTGYLNASDQSEEYGSTPRRDRLFYLAARFRQPERLHER